MKSFGLNILGRCNSESHSTPSLTDQGQSRGTLLYVKVCEEGRVLIGKKEGVEGKAEKTPLTFYIHSSTARSVRQDTNSWNRI